METGSDTGPRLDEAERLAVHRFPEISVEHRFIADDGATARAVWVCRAPSPSHLGRWAESAELSITSMSRIAAEHRPASGGVNP
jgi:hypothetical protein